MKKLVMAMFAVACAALSVFSAAPAQAQWVANTPTPVTGHAISQGQGVLSSPSPFTATGLYSVTGVGSSSYDWGNQWTQDYTWTGSGSGPYPFYVNVQPEVSGSASVGVGGYCSSGASAQDLGGTTGSYAPSGSFSKSPIGTDQTMTSASPTLTITIEAKGSGQIYYGTDTSQGDSTAKVTLGTPHT